MKKIIIFLLALLLFIVPSFSTRYYYNNYYSNNYYSKLVDKCCIISYDNYHSKLNQVSYILETKYPSYKKKLDAIVFKIVWIVNKKYANKKSYAYQKIADFVVSYAYNHNIEKWTKAYYKLAYLAYTFKYYADYFKKDNTESFLENIVNN